ncbi:MAG TPA: deoxyribodipyrimidine photo-lyase [Methylomirabilota bacterium]|nr:deoxyribodipyrimidine photo-lyase [Methylomirabilota bacterium]
MKNLESLEFDARVLRRRIGVPDADGRCVVYWMQRSQRARDNAALNVAIEAGNLLDKPVVVYFQLLPRVRHAAWRHYEFMCRGLTELPVTPRERGVAFALRRYPEHSLLSFCSEVKPCLVIGDENPLREAEQSKARVAAELRVPFWTVDADVVVPSRLLGREHYAARTIRPKIRALLKQFLQPLANPVARAQPPARFFSQSFHGLENFPIDGSIAPVSGIAGGGAAAHRTLAKFLRERLAGYATHRNKPDIEGTSRLSPYLHFGQISPHTVALAVKNSDAPAIDREAFLEELIVRRELAVNFVRYNSRYDAADACEPWAERTLRAHARDQRKFLYREAQLESAETHDPLWNAAQKQMVLTGWMHGYMRMYWAKKILEWSRSPAEAFAVAVRLNDRYELDGRDPNGYAGIAWAIVGKHDRAWGPERLVYGKIRYMSYESTSRKFNAKAYITRIAALEKGREAEP